MSILSPRDELPKVTVQFVVEYNAKRDQRVGIIGSIKEFGEWNSSEPCVLEQKQCAGGNWTVRVPITIKSFIEYKYVLLGADNAVLKWEDRGNRELQIGLVDQESIDGWACEDYDAETARNEEVKALIFEQELEALEQERKRRIAERRAKKEAERAKKEADKKRKADKKAKRSAKKAAEEAKLDSAAEREAMARAAAEAEAEAASERKRAEEEEEKRRHDAAEQKRRELEEERQRWEEERQEKLRELAIKEEERRKQLEEETRRIEEETQRMMDERRRKREERRQRELEEAQERVKHEEEEEKRRQEEEEKKAKIDEEERERERIAMKKARDEQEELERKIADEERQRREKREAALAAARQEEEERKKKSKLKSIFGGKKDKEKEKDEEEAAKKRASHRGDASPRGDAGSSSSTASSMGGWGASGDGGGAFTDPWSASSSGGAEEAVLGLSPEEMRKLERERKRREEEEEERREQEERERRRKEREEARKARRRKIDEDRKAAEDMKQAIEDKKKREQAEKIEAEQRERERIAEQKRNEEIERGHQAQRKEEARVYVENTDRPMSDVSFPAVSKLSKAQLLDDKGMPRNNWLVQHLLAEGRLEEDAIFWLIDEVKKIMRAEPNVLELQAPVIVYGDTHGQFYDLVKMTDLAGSPERNKFLFLGDYVDRGLFSSEILLFLFGLKIAHPTSVFLLRGNHESRAISAHYNFKTECLHKYSLEMYDAVMEVFDCMPLAAAVDTKDQGKFFCVHAGISRPLVESYLNLNKVERFVEPPEKGLFCDILWSDPVEDSQADGMSELELTDWHKINFKPNPTRGCSCVYGYAAVFSFLHKNKFKAIVRSHEVQKYGYAEHFFKKERELPYVITVFSAPNYCDKYENFGAFMKIADNDYKFQMMTWAEHPYYLPHYIDCFSFTLPFIAENVAKFYLHMLNYLIEDDDMDEDQALSAQDKEIEAFKLKLKQRTKLAAKMMLSLKEQRANNAATITPFAAKYQQNKAMFDKAMREDANNELRPLSLTERTALNRSRSMRMAKQPGGGGGGAGGAPAGGSRRPAMPQRQATFHMGTKKMDDGKKNISKYI